MTTWFRIPASRLHERALIFNDVQYRQATLFPFFDGEGFVERVLIVDADSSELQSFRIDTTQLRVPFWGPIRASGQKLELVDDAIDLLAPLWHYDPWWLLRAARFESERTVPTLTNTNCADSFDEKPADLLFNARMTKVAKVQFIVPAEHYKNKAFQPGMLPPRELAEPPRSQRESAGWHLDPLW